MIRTLAGLQIAGDLLRYSRRQWASRQQIDDFQSARLRAVVHHAYASVPLYRERFDAVGLRPEQVRCLGDLAALPILRRAEIEAAGIDIKLSRAFTPNRLHTARTSGSSGTPLTIWTDPVSRRLNKAQFLRALGCGGYRVGHGLLVLGGPVAGEPRWLRWHRVGRDTSPDVHLQTLRHLRPRFVYGFVTPLRRLAEALLADPAGRYRAEAVFSSGETLDRASRAMIEEAFEAPVFDIWGAMEVGTIGYECPEHTGLHVAEDVVALELIPIPGSDASRVVMTSLKSYGMPLLRYELGDLASRHEDGPCPCGRSFRRITRLQGRLIDCLRRPDGGLVPPYPIEAAVEEVRGVRRFQVVQSDVAAVTVQVVGTVDAEMIQGIRAALLPVLGDGMRVEVEGVADLEPPPGRKFRLITCRLDPETSRLPEMPRSPGGGS